MKIANSISKTNIINITAKMMHTTVNSVLDDILSSTLSDIIFSFN